ncbi:MULTISPECIES: hypothetical protein [Deefgea]|jgi:hypothetical protein|nr:MULTISPECIES: hypothetical protein [Deefgea]
MGQKIIGANILAINSTWPSVISKKNFNPEMAALSDIGEVGY